MASEALWKAESDSRGSLGSEIKHFGGTALVQPCTSSVGYSCYFCRNCKLPSTCEWEWPRKGTQPAHYITSRCLQDWMLSCVCWTEDCFRGPEGRSRVSLWDSPMTDISYSVPLEASSKSPLVWGNADWESCFFLLALFTKRKVSPNVSWMRKWIK